jgi:HAD superfamily hydrolase (TIGR01450 family)
LDKRHANYRLVTPVLFDFSAYEAVLLDLDGTLYEEDQPLPGAVALVQRLLAEGRKVGCPSNSTQSPQRVAQRLATMGMPISVDAITTAAAAAVDYCLQKFAPMPRVFNLATEGVADLLEGKAMAVQGEGEKCDVVLAGNPQCVWATVPRLNIGQRLIRNGAICIGICDDRAYPGPGGLEIGSGAMTRMLAYAGGVEPMFFGKPQREFFLDFCRRIGVRAERCVMIGDNLESDIAGAKGVGMATILSLTGVARRGDLDGVASGLRPDWVVEDLREL